MEKVAEEQRQEKQRQEKQRQEYEVLILAENTKNFPNERNVAYWVGQIKGLRKVSFEEKEKQDMLNEASEFSFFDTVSFLFISNKFQIIRFPQHLISDISICLQIFLGLLSTFQEGVAWHCGVAQILSGLIVNFIYMVFHLQIGLRKWPLSLYIRAGNFFSICGYIFQPLLEVYRKCRRVRDIPSGSTI